MKKTHYFIWFQIITVIMTIGPNAAYADSFKRNPIKDTQTQTVAVTEEMLKTEGQKGPASPTFKMEDSSKFLVQKPVQKAEEKTIEETAKSSSSWWDDWFTWKEEPKDEADSVSD